MFDHKLSGPSLAFQPLYLQVADYIKQLIVERRWVPGEALPSEFRLAEEFNVSQGTVRKALNLLTDDKIVTRRQGVGTFVSEHTAQDALFRFFPLQADGKGADLPKAELLSVELCPAPHDVIDALQLNKKDKVAIVGDVLFYGSIGRTDLPGGDYHTLITGIREKLLTLEEEWVVHNGHGPQTTIGREKKSNPFLI